MVTKKRFKVHSMIQGMEIGEMIDLELCEELIKKYGSLSDVHLLIEDNGNDMTYQEVVDLLNENEQLKQENKKLQGKYDHLLWLYNGLGCEYDWLKAENEQLKQYKQLVNDVLRSWSQKNLTAKQLQVVLAIMEELNVIGDVE